MVSARQFAANRRNAKNSTGPRTVIGKNRSKANALRHALTVNTSMATANSPEVESLASAIAGPHPDACRWFFSVVAAEAEMELRRVRTIRVGRLVAAMPGDLSEHRVLRMRCLADVLRDLVRIDRYERRALSRRNKALRLL